MHDTLSTLCTAAAEIIPPCGSAILLILLHVAALLCHKHKLKEKTNGSPLAVCTLLLNATFILIKPNLPV